MEADLVEKLNELIGLCNGVMASYILVDIF